MIAAPTLAPSDAADRALAERAARLQAILDSLDEVVFAQDFEANTYEISGSCERVFGHGREEFAADPLLWLRLIHPGDRDSVAAQYAALAGGNVVVVDARLQRP